MTSSQIRMSVGETLCEWRRAGDGSLYGFTFHPVHVIAAPDTRNDVLLLRQPCHGEFAVSGYILDRVRDSDTADYPQTHHSHHAAVLSARAWIRARHADDLTRFDKEYPS